MQLIMQARRQELDINGAKIELKELPMREFFEFLQLSADAARDARSACEIAERIERMVIKGKLARISVKDINCIISFSKGVNP